MAEMQRKRDKEKKRSDSSDILADILESVTATKEKPTPPEIKPLEPRKFQTNSSVPPVKQETRSKVTITPISTEIERPSPPKLQPGTVDPRVKPILPAWVKKPWRWMIPEDPELKKQWLVTWGDFILNFARVLNLHILDLQEIGVVYPFKNPLLKKKLTQPQLISISEYLVEIEKAIWWDEEKTRLRVYWKTLKSYTDVMFDYAFQNGYDMVTAYDLVKMKQTWSSLPPQDIRMLMKLMVKSDRASWADSERKTIQFNYY